MSYFEDNKLNMCRLVEIMKILNETIPEDLKTDLAFGCFETEVDWVRKLAEAIECFEEKCSEREKFIINIKRFFRKLIDTDVYTYDWSFEQLSNTEFKLFTVGWAYNTVVIKDMGDKIILISESHNNVNGRDYSKIIRNELTGEYTINDKPYTGTTQWDSWSQVFAYLEKVMDN